MPIPAMSHGAPSPAFASAARRGARAVSARSRWRRARPSPTGERSAEILAAPRRESTRRGRRGCHASWSYPGREHEDGFHVDGGSRPCFDPSEHAHPRYRPSPQDSEPEPRHHDPLTRWRGGPCRAKLCAWANSSGKNGAKSGTPGTTRATSSATTPCSMSGCLPTAPRASLQNQGAITFTLASRARGHTAR